ncbi:sensor histidine kinase [Xanthobacter agilis]|uniref:histidine kinase n=1 Tax=Xanthobacter agilis TaxID=47492 RepID=A0ABU0LJA2_XANAG|nr:HAMP domain-containing sensor histidine kinase [Xanthobacter agilis]MDQ0507222.1 signal transduction histidine kinase [Xanthobacter agilis]
MGSIRSIRFKLGAVIVAVAAIGVLAAGGVVLALGATDRALEAAIAAQRRLDLLTETSARLSEFGITAVADADHPTADRERLVGARDRVVAVLDKVAAETPEDLAGAASSGRARLLAHLKADFSLLDRQIGRAIADADRLRRGDAVRGALNAFAAAAGPLLSVLVESERRAVVEARAEARLLSTRLRYGAGILVVLVLAAALVLHRTLARPLLARLRQIDRAAGAIGSGVLETRLAIGSRDELGLLMAKFNRMAERLARRARKVAADRAVLEGTIAARTADLTAANTRLAAIDTSRRRFFADVSHELRTPLTVIIGECDVTQRAPAIPEDLARNVLTTIRKRAVRLNRRVEDLLRIARSESGEIDLVFQDVPVRFLLEEAVASFEVPARRQRVHLVLEAPAPGPLVHADREWLRQVVEGLIDNALRHGAPLSRITVRQVSGPDGVRIAVEDDGRGIPPEQRDRLFARFVRGAASSHSGFGLGLALAEWVVTQHGGRITLEDHTGGDGRGAGLTVAITLPAPTHEQDDAQTDALRRAGQEETP